MMYHINKLTLSLCFIVQLILLNTGLAYSQSDSYETPQILKASNILPHELLKGTHFTVLEDVISDGITNHYQVSSEFGQFKASGTEMLKNRIQEINAMVEMEEIAASEVFQESLTESVKAPFKGAANLVMHPIDSVRGVGEGVGRLFGRVGEMVMGSRGNFEDSVAKELIGFAGVKRGLAYELDIDVYSSNAKLQDQLNNLAWSGYSGGITVDVMTSVLLPGAASLAVKGTAFNDSINYLLRDKAPEDLRKINRELLNDMGVSIETRDQFLMHDWYSPRHKTIIVHALDNMKTTKNRENFISSALLAESEEDAFFFQYIAEMLFGYHKHIAQITKLINPGHGIPIGLVGKDKIIVTALTDHLYWIPDVAEGIMIVSNYKQLNSEIKHVEVWLSGRASSRTQQELQRKGFTVKEQSLAVLMPSVKDTSQTNDTP